MHSCFVVMLERGTKEKKPVRFTCKTKHRKIKIAKNECNIKNIKKAVT